MIDSNFKQQICKTGRNSDQLLASQFVIFTSCAQNYLVFTQSEHLLRSPSIYFE